MFEHFTAVFHFLQIHFNRKELLDDLKIISVKLNVLSRWKEKVRRL